MVTVKYGLLIVEVENRNRSSSSCGSSCSGYSTARFYSAPDYFQQKITCKYLCKKTVQFIYSVRVTS